MAKKPDVVVITGASAGVGRATACEFAKQGADIALLARGDAGLEGARLNVEINLGGLADAAYVAAVREEVAALRNSAAVQLRRLHREDVDVPVERPR